MGDGGRRQGTEDGKEDLPLTIKHDAVELRKMPPAGTDLNIDDGCCWIMFELENFFLGEY